MKNTRIIMNVIIAWLIGISLTMMIKAITLIYDIQANTVFVAELSENVLPGQRITAESLLKDFDSVQSSSVELISAQRAQQTMMKDMPELEYLSNNPFRDIITFKTRGIAHDDLKGFMEEVLDIQGVDQVYYDEELLASIPHSVTQIKTGLLIISILILLGALSALILRIKRDLRAHQNDIKIMSLAGSENRTIINFRRNWSIKWGLISALAAAGLTMINILFVNQTLLIDLEITFLQGIIAVLIMIGVVVVAHAATTQITLKSFLSHLNPNITS